jgi:hypothetical protein
MKAIETSESGQSAEVISSTIQSVSVQAGHNGMKERCIRMFRWLLFFINILDIVYGFEQLVVLVYLFFYHYEYFISNLSKVLFSSGMS